MDNLPIVEDVLVKNNFIYDIDIEDGDFVGDLARRSIGKNEKTVKILRYNNHIIHVNNIDNFFKCFRCPTCDTFFYKADNFNKHFLRCKRRIKKTHPKIFYSLRLTLIEKLDGFNIEYTKEQTLFKKSLFLILNQFAIIRRTKTGRNNNLDREAWTHISVNLIEFTWQTHIFVW